MKNYDALYEATHEWRRAKYAIESAEHDIHYHSKELDRSRENLRSAKERLVEAEKKVLTLVGS